MAAKRTEVTDELGARWFVVEGDPGWQAIGPLVSAHMTRIVVPKSVILTGRVEVKDVRQDVKQIETLGRMWQETKSPAVKRSFLNALRLFDCRALLALQLAEQP
jgi:hypothetical protein